MCPLLAQFIWGLIWLKSIYCIPFLYTSKTIKENRCLWIFTSVNLNKKYKNWKFRKMNCVFPLFSNTSLKKHAHYCKMAHTHNFHKCMRVKYICDRFFWVNNLEWTMIFVDVLKLTAKKNIKMLFLSLLVFEYSPRKMAKIERVSLFFCKYFFKKTIESRKIVLFLLLENFPLLKSEKQNN